MREDVNHLVRECDENLDEIVTGRNGNQVGEFCGVPFGKCRAMGRVAEDVAKFAGAVGAGVVVQVRKTPLRKIVEIGVERFAFVAEHEQRAAMRAFEREKVLVTATVEPVEGEALFGDPRRLEHAIN